MADKEKPLSQSWGDHYANTDWIRYIRSFVDRAEDNIRNQYNPDNFYEDSLIDVAALCVAAIHSHRRKAVK